MKIRAQVFEQDDGLRELLKRFLAGEGHDVVAYRDSTSCPLYNNFGNDQCCCSNTHPCADAVLLDIGMLNVNALDFLKDQRRRGCKVPDANKAVVSTHLNEALAAATKEFGCHHIRKPYRLTEIRQWINECATRLPARQQPFSEHSNQR